MKSSTNKILTLNANCFIAPDLQYLTVQLIYYIVLTQYRRCGINYIYIHHFLIAIQLRNYTSKYVKLKYTCTMVELCFLIVIN